MKILHACLLLVTAGALFGFWICLSELQHLRKDLNEEIAKRTLVEFTGLKSHHRPSSIRNDSDPFEPEAVFRYEDTRESGYAGERLRGTEGGAAGDGEAAAAETEALVRVKRRARRRESAAYYREGTEPQDMVWLTSYSRIPVSPPTVIDWVGFRHSIAVVFSSRIFVSNVGVVVRVPGLPADFLSVSVCVRVRARVFVHNVEEKISHSRPEKNEANHRS